MATDASILLGLKPMQTTNPMEMYEAGQRIETNRLAGIMNNMNMQEKQRSLQDAEAQRGIVKGFGDDSTANANMLVKGGYLKAAQDYSKAAGDLAKDNATTGKTRIEAAGLAMTQHRDQVNMIQSPDDVKRWLTAGYSNPDLKPIFERYGTLQESLGKIDAGVTNPEQLAQWKTQAGSNAEQLIKQLNPDANARLSAQTSLTTNAATVGQQERNSVRVDDRARELNSATMSKPFEVTGADGTPSLVQQDKQGNITPVEGYTPKSPVLKPIPSHVNSAIIQNSQSTGQIDRAIKLLAGTDTDGMLGDKNATGYKGYLPNNMLNRIDPQGVDTRAIISDIGSLKIHDRSGAAVTLSESPRLMPFIPLATDDAATVSKKLNKLRVELASESQAMQEIYSKEQGYRPSPVKAPAAPQAKPDAAGMEAEMRKRGLIK